MDLKPLWDDLKELPRWIRWTILLLTFMAALVSYFYGKKDIVFTVIVAMVSLCALFIVAISIIFIVKEVNNMILSKKDNQKKKEDNQKENQYKLNENNNKLIILKELSRKEKYIINVVLYNKDNYNIDENNNTIRQLISKDIIREEYYSHVFGADRMYIVNDWVKELVKKNPSMLDS